VSVRVSQKPHVETSRDFLHILPVAVARSSSDDNNFLGDVIFHIYSGSSAVVIDKRPFSPCIWAVSTHPHRLAGNYLIGWRGALLGAGAKSAVFDCFVKRCSVFVHRVVCLIMLMLFFC